MFSKIIRSNMYFRNALISLFYLFISNTHLLFRQVIFHFAFHLSNILRQKHTHKIKHFFALDFRLMLLGYWQSEGKRERKSNLCVIKDNNYHKTHTPWSPVDRFNLQNYQWLHSLHSLALQSGYMCYIVSEFIIKLITIDRDYDWHWHYGI